MTICDFCGKSINHWDDRMGRLRIDLVKSELNELRELPYTTGNSQRTTTHITDICSSCQQIVHDKLESFLRDLIVEEKSSNDKV